MVVSIRDDWLGLSHDFCTPYITQVLRYFMFPVYKYLYLPTHLTILDEIASRFHGVMVDMCGVANYCFSP